MMPRVEELPYFEDSAALFLPWAERRWAVFLDSGFPHSRQGRYDIIAADPFATLVTRGPLTEIRSQGSITLSPEDPFSLVTQYLGEKVPQLPDMPFCGGAIGYFGYDLARRLEKLPDRLWMRKHPGNGRRHLRLGRWWWTTGRVHLAGRGDAILLACAGPTWFRPLAKSRPSVGSRPILSAQRRRVEYEPSLLCKGFRRPALHSRGDCYQVNLAQRFSAYCTGNPWAAYRLCVLQPAPFSAFSTPAGSGTEPSPERFQKVTNGIVKPNRSGHPSRSRPFDRRRQGAGTTNSAKIGRKPDDRDLLRNDIGKNCEPGSVHVPGCSGSATPPCIIW